MLLVAPKPLVSRDAAEFDSSVTTRAEPSSLCARPKGSPGIVTLRVLWGEFASLPTSWFESQRLLTRRSAVGQSMVKAGKGALVPSCGLELGSSASTLAHVSVA